MRLREKRRIIVSVVLLCALILWMLSGFLRERIEEKQRNEANGKPFSVLVKPSKAEHFQTTFEAHGALVPDKTVVLKAEVSGMVVEILKEDGNRVEQGELLAKIDLQDKLAQLENSKFKQEEAKANLEAFSALKDKGYAAKVKFYSAKASFAEAKARMALIQRLIHKTKIIAPISGILSKQWIEKGDYVKEGEKLYELVKINPLQVRVQVSQYQVKSLKKGQAVQIKLVTGESLTGHIIFISPVANSATRTFTVDVSVPNPKEIQAGFSATVIFKGKKGKAHLIKPSKLFLDNKGNLGVKGVDKDNRVVFYPIQIAAGDKNGAWVLGLPDELILIERGQGFVKEGIEVDVYYE